MLLNITPLAFAHLQLTPQRNLWEVDSGGGGGWAQVGEGGGLRWVGGSSGGGRSGGGRDSVGG